MFSFIANLFSTVSGGAAIIILLIARKNETIKNQLLPIVGTLSSLVIIAGIVGFVSTNAINKQNIKMKLLETSIIELNEKINLKEIDVQNKDLEIARLREYKNQHIKFLIPAIGKDISTNETETGELSTNVSLVIEEQLKQDDKLTLFIQVVGGDEWYISGNQIDKAQIINQKALFGFVTFGVQNDGNEDYILQSGITRQVFSAGDKIRKLPDDLITSSSILIKKIGKNIKRVE